MNKGNVIEIRCKKCNKLMMEYFVCGDDSVVALQNIGIKCDRWMTQVEMAKPIMGWDYFLQKLWLKNMVEVLNFQILKIQVGRG